MLKKRWIALAGVSVAATSLWSWAATSYQLQTKLSTSGGTLQVRDKAVQSTVGTVAYANFTTSAPVPVVVYPQSGYTISSVYKSGVKQTVADPTVPFSTSFVKSAGATQSLIASFAPVKYTVTGAATANPGDSTGSVSPSSTTVNYGGSVALAATPTYTNGYVNAITVNGQPISGVTLPATGKVAFSLTNVTGNESVAVQFLAASVSAGSNKVGVINTPVTLYGSASGTGTLAWSQTSGPATATINNGSTATPSITAPVAGTYTFQVTDSVNGSVLSTSSVTATVVTSTADYMRSDCNGCHNPVGGAVPSNAFANWSASYHYSANVTCISCHTDGQMPTPVNTATVDSNGFVVTNATAGTVGTVFCTKCHSNPPVTKPVIADAQNTWHSQQQGGAANCVNCHGTPHEAKNDVQAICSQCHSDEANNFFNESPHWNNLRNNGDLSVAGDGLGSCATNKCHFKPTTNAKQACAACHSTGGANNGGDHVAASGSLHAPTSQLNADPSVDIMVDTCWACHEGSHHGTPTAEYQKSAHYLNPYYQYGDQTVACQDCHNPHSTKTAFTSYDNTTYAKSADGACDQCHARTPGRPYGIFSSNGSMVAPHQNQSGSAASTSDNSGYLHAWSSNPGWYSSPAGRTINVQSSYVTPNNTCSDCHGHNNYINAEYAQTMHADPNGRWKAIDGFKFAGYSAASANVYTPANVKQDGCVRCHTTTGFVNFVQSGFQDLRAWGYADKSDATGEVITCRACHVTGKGNITGEAEVGLPEGNVNNWNPNSIRAAKTPYVMYYNYSVAKVKKFVGQANFRNMGYSNVCIPCHSGRTGATDGSAIKALGGYSNYTTLAFAGTPSLPHGVYQAAILDAKLGYKFSTYTAAANGHSRLGVDAAAATGSVNGTGTDVTPGPCVSCHMDFTTQTGENGKSATYRKHEFSIVKGDGSLPTICSNCHGSSFTAADLDAAEANFKSAVVALAEVMKTSNNVYGTPIVTGATVTQYGNTSYRWSWADSKRGISGVSFTGKSAKFADLVGAYYNLQLLWGVAFSTTDEGAFAHNPQYLKQLTYDTINSLVPAGQSVAGVIAAMPADPASPDGYFPGFDATTQDSATSYLNNINNHYAAANASGYKVQYMTGSATCTTCHNPQESDLQKQAREAWAESEHGQTSGVAFMPGSSHLWRSAGATTDFSTTIPANDCQRCHTADGYAQFVDSNFTNITPVDTAANATTNAPINCNACHTNDNFDRRSVNAVSTFYNISTVDKVTKQTVKVHLNATFPNVGESNICISCHSARLSGASLVAAVNNGLSLNNSGFQNSHYLGAAGVMYVKAGFSAFTSATATIGTSTYGASLTANTDGGAIASTHRKLGTTAINGDSHNPSFFVAGVLDSNGPCVTCHMKGYGNNYNNGSDDRPGAGHSLDIDADAYAQVCSNCHKGDNGHTFADATTGSAFGDFQKFFLEANSEALQTSLQLITELLKKNYNIEYDGNAYPYFFKGGLAHVNANAVSDWTLGGTLGNASALKLEGACFNLNLLTKEPAAYAHARTYSRRLVYDTVDFLDDGVINLSVSNTLKTVTANLSDPLAGQLNVGPVAYDGGAPYAGGTLDAQTSEASAFILGWSGTGAWSTPERP